jgi:Tfp pilus assembly PilM family ATPase
MKKRTQTVLGIDISKKWVSAAFLCSSGDRVSLDRAVKITMPAGCLTKGEVVNPDALKKILSELVHTFKIGTEKTVISLSIRPVLIQIVDTPRNLPDNIRKFVQAEIRQYVAFAGDNIMFDYSGINSASSTGRLLTVAADSGKINDLVDTCMQSHINVEMVEPCMLAYARVIYQKKIANRIGCNVLLVILRETNLTLSVFRGNSIDFVRRRNMADIINDPAALVQQITEEIDTIIQYYEIEVPQSSSAWKLILYWKITMLNQSVLQRR